MAAFEAISKIEVRTLGSREEIIDIRVAKLPDETPPESDFDPRKYRDPKVTIQPWMAYFNLLRTAVGIGLLGMPMSISQGGLLLGQSITLLIGLIIIQTHTSLLWSLNEISRQLKIPYISYRYGFRIALLHGPPILHGLGHSGPPLIAICMVTSQIGICTVLVIFASDNLRDLMDWRNDKFAFAALYIPYIVLELTMKTLKRVSYISMAGNVLSLLGLVLVTIEIFREGRFTPVRLASSDLVQVLVSFGVAVFNMSSIGVILSCDKALKQPQIMTKVIRVGILVPTVMSCLFGGIGYWAFGIMEENLLRYLNYDNVTTLVIFSIYILIVTTAYPLQCFPAVQVMLEVIKNHDPQVSPDQKVLTVIEYFARPVFVTITFMIAYMVPFQGPFISFVGNFCTILVSIVFPALIELSVLYPDRYGRFNIHLIKNIAIIMFGLLTWLMGVALCGYLIYIRILSLYSPNSDESSYLKQVDPHYLDLEFESN